METKFLGKLGNSKLFSPKIRWSPPKKKKKGLHQNWEWFFGRDPKFKGFFRPKSSDLQKKKGLHRYRDWFFVQFRKFRRLRGAAFEWGGAIFHFSQKIGLKSIKNMRFCLLHKPMGGLEPPRPPPWLRYWLLAKIKLLLLEPNNWIFRLWYILRCLK